MREIRTISGADERTTVVKTSRLLDALRTNREAHLKEYEEAVAGYLDVARQKLDKEYKVAKDEVDRAFNRVSEELKIFDPTKIQDTIVFCRDVSFTLTAPRSYVDAYDQAIQMMEWETRDEVELNATEFRCFVMNKWDWMDSFKSVSAKYKR